MTSNGRILILTCEDDSHADHMVLTFKKRGIRPLRFHTKDFPMKATINICAGEYNSVEFNCESGRLKSEEIDSVWYRRPEKPQFHESLVPHERDVAEKESSATLSGIYRVMDKALWVNHPDDNRICSSKILQLKKASLCGFCVPDTLITNDPTIFKNFYDKHSGNVIMKTQRSAFLSLEEGEAIYTSKIVPNLLEYIDLISHAPCFFQEYISKAFELRVIVIGKQIFTAALYSQETTTGRIDWRQSQPGTLRHEKYNLPKEIESKIMMLMQTYNLNFSAIDMIVTPQGEYVFLEINPNGQFGWIKAKLGFPLYDTLADLLCSAGK